MAFSYTGDPASSDRDALRFRLGDTDADRFELHDAELDYLITTYGAGSSAIYEACRVLLRKTAGRVTKQVGDLTINYSDLRANWQAALADAKLEMALDAGGLYAGGVSISDVQTVEDDADRIQPAFERSAFDNPQYGSALDIRRST